MNPLFNSHYNSPFGIRIIESAAMADQIIDTSGCRSPSRALRRFRRGIRGRVIVTYKPWTHAYQTPDGSLAMHPAMAAELRKHLADKRS